MVVAEPDAGPLDLAGDFHIDRGGAVDQHVGNVVAGEHRLQRTVSENVVADVVEQLARTG